ncbi:MAG: PAS domain S-box protein [Candidatus Sulfotelmatobacter sp.]
MELHPGPEQRHVSEASRAELDPIRRALQENEDWYQDLVVHSHDLLCIHDLAGRLLSVNPAPARILGYSEEELLQIPMREIIVPEFRPQFDAYLSQMARVGESRGFMAVMTRSGERRIWHYHNTLRTEGVASPIVRGIARDVTEQRETEKLLREVGERLLSKLREGERTIRELKLFRTLVDQSNDSIKVIDPETLRFLDVNEKACSELGYSREQLLSLTVFDIDPAVTESSAAKVKEEWRESGFIVMETLHRRRNGSTFPVEVSMRRVRLDRDYIVAISRDITERKQAEEALRESEARARAKSKELETILDTVPVAVFIARDVDCKYVTTNRTGYEQLRLPSGANISKSPLPGERPWARLMRDGVEVPIEELPMERAAATARPVYGVPLSLVFEDGTERHMVSNAVPLLGEDGRPTGVVGALIDVTERKRAEDAVRERERTQKLILDHLPVGIILSSVGEEKALYQNPKFLELFGYSIERFPTVAEWWPLAYPDPVYREWVSQEWQRRMAEAARTQGEIEPMEVTITCHDGTKKYVRVLAQVIGDRNFITFIDLSERKQAEQALKKSEEKFSKAFRQSPTSITLTTIKEHRYIEVNETFERMTGWRRDEVIGRMPFDIGLWVNPDQRVELAKQLLAEGCLRDVEAGFRKKDGAIRVGLVTAEVIELNGEPCAIAAFADITDRMQAEEALRRSEENYRNFVSQSSEGIFRQDLDNPVPVDLPEDELVHHILYDSYLAECNEAIVKMYGLSSVREFVGKRLTEMLSPEDPRNIELTRDYIRSGFRVLDRESHEVDVHGNPKVFRNSMIGIVENGKLVRTWGIQRDVTEKVKLEEACRKAEEALRENVARLQIVSEELRVAKEKLSEEKLYLEQAIDTELGFGEIIGRSGALKEVMEKVAKVAPSDATVLLLGETGTGKELVARAIHGMSERKDSTFIKLNCAAIPSGLLESELFGHEKGAFTGAIAKKLGRLELADRGTLFLDEIGEIPLDLQPKLLRVLQDQEFERLGGTQTLKVDFRLVAATNRDLRHSVNQREFRGDLYYRLNVFPIRMPPLRERRDDIPLLIEHFVRKYAGRMNKSILSVPAKTMETLVQWAWPGNIRELENFVERSVILTPGSVLQAPLSELHTEPDRNENETLREKERERIIRVLRECNGQLGGPNGAAARLGLKRTTLQSKLTQLRIKPKDYRK